MIGKRKPEVQAMIRKLSYLAAAIALAAPAVAQTPIPPHQPGTICLTQFGWCWLGQAFPLGAPCYCATPRGPVYGRTI